MSDRVTVTLIAGVADVRLARPEKMNALDPAMFDALRATAGALSAERALRAVVLSGEGRAFCAGLDFVSFMKMADGPRPTNLLANESARVTTLAQDAAWLWRELPVPVIAAVHGVAFGGGLQLALAADIRIATPDAQLSVMEIKWGLIPDMTGTQTLRHLVRQDVAKDLTYTGRLVRGEEAAALGLVTRVSATPLDDALALAREIASKSPHAIRAGKRLLDAAYLDTEADGLRREADEQRALLGSANQTEAVQANFEKRPARFGEAG
jgi:enoyl-CoA hydratase/carnithine racemase